MYRIATVFELASVCPPPQGLSGAPAIALLKVLVNQDKTLQEMADILNKDGFVTSQGCQFTRSKVYKLIKRYNLLKDYGE